MTAPIGPRFELQKAIAAILAADADLKTLIGDPPRVYQEVPAKVRFPYVSFGDFQKIPDLAECIDGSEIFPTLHIWSRATTYAEAESISETIAAALVGATFTMTQNRCLLFERDDIGDQQQRDPDGVTIHIASHYRAITEPV